MKLIANPPLPYWATAEQDRAVPARPKWMREANVRELLRLMRQHSPCSRADLVRLSGLTAPTVSAGIKGLRRSGLVNLIGSGTSSGGRPPSLIEFNARHGYVCGADVGGSNVRLALADLNGAVLGRWNSVLRSDRTPDAVTDMIATGVDHLCRQYGIAPNKVLELVAGAPGVTDVHAGRVLSAPNLTGWDDVPFRELLETKTGISSTIENDVNLGALGESWCGAARNISNFVFLAIGTGVGAGIVLNGLLLHGASWSAGEVGYMMLPGLPDEPLDANRLGALENAIGGKRIESAWAELVKPDQNEVNLTTTEILARASSGDSRARDLLRRTAGHLAMAITNLGLVLDISLVVLGGGVGGHRVLLEATRQLLERNQFARPQLVASNLGGDAQLYGAVWLALQVAETRGFHRASIDRGQMNTTSVIHVA